MLGYHPGAKVFSYSHVALAPYITIDVLYYIMAFPYYMIGEKERYSPIERQPINSSWHWPLKFFPMIQNCFKGKLQCFRVPPICFSVTVPFNQSVFVGCFWLATSFVLSTSIPTKSMSCFFLIRRHRGHIVEFSQVGPPSCI